MEITTNYKITSLDNTRVSLSIIEEVMIEGKLFVRTSNLSYSNNKNSIDIIKQTIPEPHLSAILVRWETNEVIVLKKDDIVSNNLLLFVLPYGVFDEYDPNGYQYKVNDVFVYNNVKYVVIQDFESNTSIRPEFANSRDTIQPYQGTEPATWMYGETISMIGIEREYEGKWFVSTTIMSSQDNRTTPDMSKNWKGK